MKHHKDRAGQQADLQRALDSLAGHTGPRDSSTANGTIDGKESRETAPNPDRERERHGLDRLRL